MIKVAICDDNEMALDSVKEYVDKGFSAYTDDYSVKSYTNGQLMLQDNEQTPFDVMFLDIDMPEIGGFDIAKKLRSDFSRCFIIFITSHSNLVYKSFDFQPFNFIQKDPPESLCENIGSVIAKLMEHMKQNEKIIINNESKPVVVYYHNIIYVESDKHYLKHFIQNQETPLLVRASINDKESEFEKYGFIRIHRKFIVNLKFINFVDVKIGKVYINYNGTRKSLPMGNSYRDNVEKKYTEYLRDTL